MYAPLFCTVVCGRLRLGIRAWLAWGIRAWLAWGICTWLVLGIRPGALAVFRPQLYPGALVQIRRPRTDYQIVGGQS